MLAMADVPRLARLIGGLSAARRIRPAGAAPSFDLHLIGVQQVRDRLFPGRDIFVADLLFFRFVVSVVVVRAGILFGFTGAAAGQNNLLRLVIVVHESALIAIGSRRASL